MKRLSILIVLVGLSWFTACGEEPSNTQVTKPSANDCKWDGRWKMLWNSSTGEYANTTYFWSDASGVRGSYDSGIVEAKYTENPYQIIGQWRRLVSDPNASCDYGKVELMIFRDTESDVCRLVGAWDYCDKGMQSWEWSGTWLGK